MRQAIVTKFIGPTNYRGSRVKATAAAGSVTVHWDHALNPDDNHAKAAKALAEKYGWGGEWHGGGMPGNSGNVYVAVELVGNDELVTPTAIPTFVTHDRYRRDKQSKEV